MKRNKLIPIEPGLIRLSGLPYGFFERELYSYFSQFGVVTRLKLIRSKKKLVVVVVMLTLNLKMKM